MNNEVFENNIKHLLKKKQLRNRILEINENIKLNKNTGFDNIQLVDLFEDSPKIEEITLMKPTCGPADMTTEILFFLTKK